MIYTIDLVTPASSLLYWKDQNIAPVKVIMQESAIVLHDVQRKKDLEKTAHKLMIGPWLGSPRFQVLLCQLIIAVQVRRVFLRNCLVPMQRRVHVKEMQWKVYRLFHLDEATTYFQNINFPPNRLGRKDSMNIVVFLFYKKLKILYCQGHLLDRDRPFFIEGCKDVSTKHLSVLALIPDLRVNTCVLKDMIVLVPRLVVTNEKTIGFIKGIIFDSLPSGRHTKFFLLFFFTPY
jgi:hypothetical protein